MRSLGSLFILASRVLEPLQARSFKAQAGPLAPPHILTQEASQPRAEALLFLLSGQVLNGLPSPKVLGPLPWLLSPGRSVPVLALSQAPEKCLLQGGREQTGGIGKPGLPQAGGVLSIRTFPPSESFPTSAIPLEAGLAGREPGSPSAPRHPCHLPAGPRAGLTSLLVLFPLPPSRSSVWGTWQEVSLLNSL